MWFGPRRWMGWGWTPASWEGWAVMGVFVAVVIGLGVARLVPLVFVAIAAMLLVCFLKGTPPGGPSAWKEYKASREG